MVILKFLPKIITKLFLLEAIASFLSLNCESQIYDTVKFHISEVKDFLPSGGYSYVMGIYYVNGEDVPKDTYFTFKNKSDSIFKIINDNAGKYFVFLYDNNIKSAEGRWDGQNYFGLYRCYYPDGVIKEYGKFTDENDSLYRPGQRIGNWNYYGKDGAITKIENYNIGKLCKNWRLRIYDTIVLNEDYVNQFFHDSNFGCSNGKYTIRGEDVPWQVFAVFKKNADSIREVISANMGKYFVFVDNNRVKVREGRWWIGFFTGYYKSYYPNGALKEEGDFTKNSDEKYLPGNKIGNWKNYSESGAVKSTIFYTPSFNDTRQGRVGESPIILEGIK